MPPLVLGSTSAYRRALLSRFGVPFEVDRPEVDETPRPGEAPASLADRLAEAKARAIAARHPGACVIGSDQVAELAGQPLGKPGTRENAIAQLTAMAGAEVHFHTAVCVVHPGGVAAARDLTVVRFRALAADEIARYVDREQPLDCAGSFKSEGLGITLFDAIRTDDPTALVGLPLIATARLLRAAGLTLP